jgi:predicted unusual protein kinase regulating ubiquinone biosynthesis (AarF/ABC1/UbiB family)
MRMKSGWVGILLIHFFIMTSILGSISKPIYAQGEELNPTATASTVLLDEAKKLRSCLQDFVKISLLPKENPEREKQIKQEMKDFLTKHTLFLAKQLVSPDHLSEVLKTAQIPSSELYQIEKLKVFFTPQISSLAHSALSQVKEEQIAELINKAMDIAPIEHLVKIIESRDEKIHKMAFSQMDAVKSLIDPQRGLDLSRIPKSLADLVTMILEKYFDELPLQDKKQLIMALLELSPEATSVQQLSVFVQNSGPVLQKLIQLVGNSAKSPYIVEVLQQLKSNIKSYPTEQAKEAIEKGYGKPMSELFVSFNEKPLGAASVGQVYLAKVAVPSKKKNSKIKETKDVVVKVLRPGIHEKAERELQMMERLAPSEGAKKIVLALRESLMEELDCRIEGDYMNKSQFYNDKKLGIKAIKLFEEFPPQKNILVMEKAPGKTFDKQNETRQLEKKLEAVIKLYQKWLHNAVFGDGLFHADLHSGNLFFEDKTTVPGHLITLIDFGSMGTLSKVEKKAIVNLGLGAVTKSATPILKSFEMISPMTEEQKKQFKKTIEEVLAQKNSSDAEKMGAIITKATELGLALPKNFLQFNRGKAFLDTHINELYTKLQKQKLTRKQTKSYMIPNYSDTIVQKVFVKGLGPDIRRFFLPFDGAPKMASRALYEKVIKKAFYTLFTKTKKPKTAHCVL